MGHISFKKVPRASLTTFINQRKSLIFSIFLTEKCRNFVFFATLVNCKFSYLLGNMTRPRGKQTL